MYLETLHQVVRVFVMVQVWGLFSQLLSNSVVLVSSMFSCARRVRQQAKKEVETHNAAVQVQVETLEETLERLAERAQLTPAEVAPTIESLDSASSSHQEPPIPIGGATRPDASGRIYAVWGQSSWKRCNCLTCASKLPTDRSPNGIHMAEIVQHGASISKVGHQSPASGVPWNGIVFLKLDSRQCRKFKTYREAINHLDVVNSLSPDGWKSGTEHRLHLW